MSDLTYLTLIQSPFMKINLIVTIIVTSSILIVLTGCIVRQATIDPYAKFDIPVITHDSSKAAPTVAKLRITAKNAVHNYNILYGTDRKINIKNGVVSFGNEPENPESTGYHVGLTTVSIPPDTIHKIGNI
jgi:hypothetical protein